MVFNNVTSNLNPPEWPGPVRNTCIPGRVGQYCRVLEASDMPDWHFHLRQDNVSGGKKYKPGLISTGCGAH
jgi:hypothetical protein